MTAPLACLAIFPVEIVMVLPQHSACTICSICRPPDLRLAGWCWGRRKKSLASAKAPQGGFIHVPNKEKGTKALTMVK
jgi:hypothetical protein